MIIISEERKKEVAERNRLLARVLLSQVYLYTRLASSLCKSSNSRKWINSKGKKKKKKKGGDVYKYNMVVRAISLSLSLFISVFGREALFLYILPSFWPIFWYFFGGFLEIDHHHNIIGRRDEMLGYILWYPSSTCIKVSACCCWDPREWCPVRTRGEAMKSKKNKNKIKHGERARVIWNRRLRLSKKKRRERRKKSSNIKKNTRRRKKRKKNWLMMITCRVCAVWRAPANGWDDPLAGGWIVIIHHWLFWVLRIMNEGNRWERAIIITKKLCV